jgi:hypothetical protein
MPAVLSEENIMPENHLFQNRDHGHQSNHLSAGLRYYHADINKNIAESLLINRIKYYQILSIFRENLGEEILIRKSDC